MTPALVLINRNAMSFILNINPFIPPEEIVAVGSMVGPYTKELSWS